MSLRLAVLVSHPIQHFAPWHRELARLGEIDLKVFFCCDWGVSSYLDPQFKTEVKWDIPLLEGYAHEFLPIARRPQHLTFWEVDNPSVSAALDRFDPDLVKVFGYAHLTNWRAARWAHRNRRPILLYSDSSVKSVPSWWKRYVKDAVVRRFYSYVDGAMFVGGNNWRYHRRYGIPTERLFSGVLPVDRTMLLEAVPDRTRTSRELRGTLGIPQDAFVVLFCGKYVARKRPIDIVDAVCRLRGRGLPIWALLVGEGEERLAIEAFSRSEAVETVVLTGFVNQSNIARFYAAADILAVTSETDPHPLIVSEAACFGLPVVISDRVGCIGPDDSAQPEGNALVYPCGDVWALANAIEKLFRDWTLYQRMSARSLEIARDQDVSPAARQLASAAQELFRLGPRSRVV